VDLADMFARDLFEWVRGECGDDAPPRHWARFGQKIHRRGDGRMGTSGVKVFPITISEFASTPTGASVE